MIARQELLALSGAFFVTVLLPGCKHSVGASSRIEAKCEIYPRPAKVGFSSITIRLIDHGASATGAHLKLEADMSHPGMSPVFADVSETAPGRYESHLNFTMAGDWVLTVRGSLADGEHIEKEVPLPGVRPD